MPCFEFALGAGLGAGIVLRGRAKPSSDRIEAPKGEREAAADVCQVTQHQVEEKASENELAKIQEKASENELANSQEVELEEGKILHELETLRAEFETCANVAEQCEVAEQRVRALESERESICEEAEKGAKAREKLENVRLEAQEHAAERDAMAARCQEAERRIQVLLEKQSILQNEIRHSQLQLGLERQSMCHEAEKGVRTKVELEDVRVRVEQLMFERDAAVAQHQAVAQQVRSLKEQQASLHKQLATNKMKRKDSTKRMSQTLSDIVSQFDHVQKSWTPWEDVAKVREKMGSVRQENVSEDEDEYELLKGA